MAHLCSLPCLAVGLSEAKRPQASLLSASLAPQTVLGHSPSLQGPSLPSQQLSTAQGPIMDSHRQTQPPYPPVSDSVQQPALYTMNSNQYSMPAQTSSPYQAPQNWQQQQQQQRPQPTYPYVAEGVSDAVSAQHRDTTSSPVSTTSSGIPAGRAAASYPVISPAGLDQDPKQKQQPPVFPDIQLNKDVARPVLSARPVAVAQEPARQGTNRYLLRTLGLA